MRPEHLPPPKVRLRMVRERLEVERARMYDLSLRLLAAEALGDQGSVQEVRQEIARAEKVLDALVREERKVQEEAARGVLEKPPLPFRKEGG